jgi:hypothetical protein
MTCARCHAEHSGKRWCAECERAYDGWVRQYASDMIVPALGGMVVVLAIGMGLPLLGASTLIAVLGAFGGFGTIFGLARANTFRRRRQFLRDGGVPRAYLPAPTR